MFPRILYILILLGWLGCGQKGTDKRDRASDKSGADSGDRPQPEYRRDDAPRKAPRWALEAAASPARTATGITGMTGDSPDGSGQEGALEEAPEGSDATQVDRLAGVRHLPVKELEEIPEELRKYLKDLPPGARIHYGESAPIVAPKAKKAQPTASPPPRQPKTGGPCEVECQPWSTKSAELYGSCIKNCLRRDISNQADAQLRQLETTLRDNVAKERRSGRKKNEITQEDKKLIKMLEAQLIEELKKLMQGDRKEK